MHQMKTVFNVLGGSLSVCPSVCHAGRLCKNSWTDRPSVLRKDFWSTKTFHWWDPLSFTTKWDEVEANFNTAFAKLLWPFTTVEIKSVPWCLGSGLCWDSSGRECWGSGWCLDSLGRECWGSGWCLDSLGRECWGSGWCLDSLGRECWGSGWCWVLR